MGFTGRFANCCGAMGFDPKMGVLAAEERAYDEYILVSNKVLKPSHPFVKELKKLTRRKWTLVKVGKGLIPVYGGLAKLPPTKKCKFSSEFSYFGYSQGMKVGDLFVHTGTYRFRVKESLVAFKKPGIHALIITTAYGVPQEYYILSKFGFKFVAKTHRTYGFSRRMLIGFYEKK